MKPSSTSATASRRLAGVIKFSAPISSSAPQRPQLVNSVFHCSYCASVTARSEPVWAHAPDTASTDSSATADSLIVIFIVFPPPWKTVRL